MRGEVEGKHRDVLVWSPFGKGLGWEREHPKHLPALGFHMVRCSLQPEEKEGKKLTPRRWGGDLGTAPHPKASSSTVGSDNHHDPHLARVSSTIPSPSIPSLFLVP